MKKILFKEISDEFRHTFERECRRAGSICITSHFSPDDDSISSILSVYYYLTRYLKIEKNRIEIIYTGESNNRWRYFSDFKKVRFVKDIFNYVKDKDLVILLDGSYWNRFSREEEIVKYNGEVICIDHHPMDKAQFHYHLNIEGATSTAEIVYRLFFAEARLDREICEVLLLGILGDTGNFKYIDSSKAGVLAIGQRLITEGNINVEAFESKYTKINLDTYKGLSELISNSEIKEIEGWPRFLFSYISSAFAIKNGLTDSQLSEAAIAFAPYLKTINGIDWGIALTPRMHDKTFSVSLRSQPGSVIVRRVMEEMKIGGGLDRAAGGKLKTFDVNEASEMIFSWMRKNNPLLS